jgi:hypothetical protein
MLRQPLGAHTLCLPFALPSRPPGSLARVVGFSFGEVCPPLPKGGLLPLPYRQGSWSGAGLLAGPHPWLVFSRRWGTAVQRCGCTIAQVPPKHVMWNCNCHMQHGTQQIL